MTSQILRRRSLVALAAFLSLLIVALVGCQKAEEKFINTDLTGLDYAKDFSLTDHHGKLRTLKDFKGKAVIIFFGYTQCPDVCPTTMAEMAKAMKLMGSQADRVQVLFVTVDPERDTQDLLAAYMPNFDPRFLALRGDAETTAKVGKEFKIFYKKNPGTGTEKPEEHYTVDHTAASYVFDPEGRIRLYLQYGQKPEAIAHDIGILLR